MINKDEMKGKARQFEGKVKEGVGSLIDDPELQEEGQTDQAAGAARESIGTARRKVGEAVEKLGETIKR